MEKKKPTKPKKEEEDYFAAANTRMYGIRERRKNKAER